MIDCDCGDCQKAREILTENVRLRDLLGEAEAALSFEEHRCGCLRGPLGDALVKIRAQKGGKTD